MSVPLSRVGRFLQTGAGVFGSLPRMNGGTHVLVVDDERDFRESTRILLTMEGFRVSEAGSGDDAVRLVQQRAASAHPIDVMLLDFRMPGKNGGQTLLALRELGMRTCAILVSAAADLETISSTFGFDDVVAKPCDFAELLAAISRCRSRCPHGMLTNG